jgi:uncharacterized protein
MSEKPDILLFLSKNKERLKKKYHLTRIGVFGSVVRNDFSDDSDIDIIVEFEENTPDLYSIKLNIKKEIAEHFERPVDVCREKYIKPIFKDKILSEAVYV